MWEQKTETSSERFDHYYTAPELDEWTPRIAALADSAEEVHLILNTNNYDQGPANAELLGGRLRVRQIEPTPAFIAPEAEPPAPQDAGDAQQGTLL
jgi:uncharacterized protein YecE (DUF72 family)